MNAPSDPYKITAGPPLVSQVCLRCGAEVGSRAVHDRWHDETTPARTPSAPDGSS